MFLTMFMENKSYASAKKPQPDSHVCEETAGGEASGRGGRVFRFSTVVYQKRRHVPRTRMIAAHPS
jgi:hypothetical protein